MHPGLWREIWILIGIAVLSLFFGALTDHPFLIAAGGFGFYIAWTLRHLRNLHRWLLDRRAGDYPRQKVLHQEAARRMKVELFEAEFSNYEAVAKFLARFRRDGIRAVLLAPSFTLIARRREVAGLAARNRVALFAHRVEWAEAGALLSYGAEIADALRRSAAIADRILKGARPAEIPVEQATRIELVVSRRTARELHITLPGPLLRRANQIID